MTLLRTLPLTILLLWSPSALAQPAAVRGGRDGLEYATNDRGDRVPDFSHCGYAGGDEPLPDVPTRVVVTPVDGDDGARIQAAIDHVGARPPGDNGLRGAVLLASGEFDVAGSLKLAESGVVLRGAGAGDGGTVIVATGDRRRTLITVGARVEPAAPRPGREDSVALADEYVPVGATTLRVESDHGLREGDRVVVTRPSTDEWIELLGARVLGVGWRAGRTDIRWDRTIMAVDGDTITLDAPLTTALDKRYGGGFVSKPTREPRARRIGVEDLALRSEYDGENPKDEEHSWFGVVANEAEDVWIRRVRFEHFAGGAVLLREGVKAATVEDCLCLAPVSELGGYRRHSFFTQGQLTLFLRCWAEEGRHDFSVGHCAPGPNAFVNCYAYDTNNDSGPLESWASGVLYDNVRIDGGDLALENRWLQPPGAGWSAANCLAWQCQAAQLRCFQPPLAMNWVIGYWAQPIGDGRFFGESEFVRPISLYQAQLAERVGESAAERVDPLLLDPVGSTNPSLSEAAEFVAGSVEPAVTLRDVIEERMASAPSRALDGAVSFDAIEGRSSASSAGSGSAPKGLEVVNGWLTVDGRLATGGYLSPTWWRGTIRPADAPSFGPSITRYAPGRVGEGLTDDLDQVADDMARRGRLVYDHHYGLWYDRRRDDHLMVRRADGDVAPPFFEQPFARTGKGTAWDGLSRYDLTRFNPWYWRRLRDFAQRCDQRGLVLFHQNYFQHNILEAGAHWADCPWRPANNVNETGLPEPPPYVGDKRIFIAEQFYDVTNDDLRALHEGYIRQCLDNFVDRSNVIQMTSAEFSGPLAFTKFWVDTVAEWEAEKGDAMIGLSAPKNVQDAILGDSQRRAAIDVIDIRYWCYGRDGDLYAPPGGVNLAPRQHLRQAGVAPADFDSIARAVREYRTRFPEKAVTYYADQNCRSGRDGWAVLMGGGSLANVPPLPAGLLRAIPSMKPIEPDGDALMLAAPGREYLAYARGPFELALPAGRYAVTWIDDESGEATPGDGLTGGRAQLSPRARVVWVSREE